MYFIFILFLFNHKCMQNMKELISFVNEGLNAEDFFNKVKNIISGDDLGGKILTRTSKYDENKLKNARSPKLLIKDNDGSYNWLNLAMYDDYKGTSKVIGIYIARMFYPITDETVIEKIKDKYLDTK